MTDPIADLITRIKNAQAVSKSEVTMPYSNFKMAILSVMKKYRIIESVEVLEDKTVKQIKIVFGENQICHIKRLSKPGRRLYVKSDKIPRPLRGLGLIILSTPSGVISGRDAKKMKIGGELVCEVW